MNLTFFKFLVFQRKKIVARRLKKEIKAQKLNFKTQLVSKLVKNEEKFEKRLQITNFWQKADFFIICPKRKFL